MCIVMQMEAIVNQSLQDLESHRNNLFRQLESLGDFRRGTISANYRKCGKSNCACATGRVTPATDRSTFGMSAWAARPRRGICLWDQNWKRWKEKWNDTARLSVCASKWWKS